MPGGHSLSHDPRLFGQDQRERDQPGHVVVLHLVLTATDHSRFKVLQAKGFSELGSVQRCDQSI
ncbi:hypothetical protein D3C85_1661390 [compost metagenome]